MTKYACEAGWGDIAHELAEAKLVAEKMAELARTRGATYHRPKLKQTFLSNYAVKPSNLTH
jgi:hypothetical protein